MLMRRYWQPIAAAGELYERPTKAVRILGEDLVLYKDRSGTLGLIDRFCPHRRVDLSYGIPEEHGLRCMYHGWMMDETGQCIEQPFEGDRPPGRALQGEGEGRRLPGPGAFRTDLRLHGATAHATPAALGTADRRERGLRHSHHRTPLQLAPVPGELPRPRAHRVAPLLLDAVPAACGRPDRKRARRGLLLTSG